MAFQTELKPLLERAIESIGVKLELSTTFKAMQSNSIFDEILAIRKELSDLDMRAQINYSMLLFSIGKVYHNYVTISQKAEAKRKRRKAQDQADRPVTDSICIQCSRDCHSRIGRSSHT